MSEQTVQWIARAIEAVGIAIIVGLIVLIRTFLSFSLELEVNGRWPWQEPKAEV